MIPKYQYINRAVQQLPFTTKVFSYSRQSSSRSFLSANANIVLLAGLLTVNTRRACAVRLTVLGLCVCVCVCVCVLYAHFHRRSKLTC